MSSSIDSTKQVRGPGSQVRKNIQSEGRKEKKKKKEDSGKKKERDLWNMVKMSNKDIQNPGRKGQNEAKRYWLKISKLMKDIKPSIQETLQTPDRLTTKKSAKHITGKLRAPKRICKSNQGGNYALL